MSKIKFDGVVLSVRPSGNLSVQRKGDKVVLGVVGDCLIGGQCTECGAPHVSIGAGKATLGWGWDEIRIGVGKKVDVWFHMEDTDFSVVGTVTQVLDGEDGEVFIALDNATSGINSSLYGLADSSPFWHTDEFCLSAQSLSLDAPGRKAGEWRMDVDLASEIAWNIVRSGAMPSEGSLARALGAVATAIEEARKEE